MTLAEITDALVAEVEALSFAPPTTHVYDPLVYARAAWDRYCELWGRGPREILLLGMNPGPFGMAQVGVPFGEVTMVREWLRIEAPIGRPENEHPRRPILGFSCPRSEVSGRRLWGWARDRFGTPEAFFERFFVANYCPLAFMEESGRNRTPDKLPRAEREPLFEACDRALARTVALLRPRWVLGVGAFATRRARAALEALPEGERPAIGTLLHPSPASPRANRGWAKQADETLRALGLL